MIKGRIRELHQIDGGINLLITIQYPRFPDGPHQDDFCGEDAEKRFEDAKVKFEIKKETYMREKQEIDFMRLGLVNLFQDDSS